MDYPVAKITRLLIQFFENDDRRVQHALAVWKYAETIASKFEGDYDYDVLVASALLHDVGIKESERLHGYNNGKTQEQYGPAIADDLLKSIDFPENKRKKVSEIIGNHHSPSKYDYPELEILKQADRIVNREAGE